MEGPTSIFSHGFASLEKNRRVRNTLMPLREGMPRGKPTTAHDGDYESRIVSVPLEDKFVLVSDGHASLAKAWQPDDPQVDCPYGTNGSCLGGKALWGSLEE